MTKTGLLGDAFFVTYMISAPILGLLADRFSRWIIVGSAVILWSLASGCSGLAATFAILFATRICVGIGEGGYGPAAPTILSDLFPIEKRGRIMAIFCAAIPVGSALGYVIGGLIGAHLGWRWAKNRRSEEHTSELQSPYDLVCRLLLEKKKNYT